MTFDRMRPDRARRCARSSYLRTVARLALLVCGGAGALLAQGKAHQTAPTLPVHELARRMFGNDAAWYEQNIPFLEIDDAAIQQTYYYRWQVYHAHLHDLGEQGWQVDEFLPPVIWARKPAEDLNDSSSFHILEGRWLRNPAYVTGLVDHLYTGGGNDRHFSESVAAATLAWTEVTGDAQPAIRHLDAMQHIYNLWDDHLDAARNLYWIEPLLDATEFTIGSIDASGQGFADVPAGSNQGFTGGYAFRPSINAYQYANALAIATFAQQAGQLRTAADFRGRAERLQAATLQQLWNPALDHFTDVYQRSTRTVRAGDFIRGRELVGMVPWQFELPPRNAAAGAPRYAAAWRHVLQADELAGQTGLRTAEPSYPRYMAQYRYDAASGRPECQWNGPSWPFQTSQTLTGLANLLVDYPASYAAQSGVDASAFVRLLRQYTGQHRLASGVLDIQEDYDPDKGGPIVGLSRSHHYLHSTYIDVVLSGLLGIRPDGTEALHLHPLLPAASSGDAPIRFFQLSRLRYHGHELTIVFDRDGTHYHQGAGLSVWSDGRLLRGNAPPGDLTVPLPQKTVEQARQVLPVNLAVNAWGRAPSAFEPDLPVASASSEAPAPALISSPAPMLYQPLDGRSWFFPEIAHGWSPATAPPSDEDWYAVDLRHSRTIARVELAFFDDAHGIAAPAAVRLQRKVGQAWQDVPQAATTTVIANGPTVLQFAATEAQTIRIVLRRVKGLPPRLISFRVFGP